MNTILQRLLDEDGVNEDVVPVLANVPRAVSANRRRRAAQSTLRRALGEAEEPLIPDEAEDMERNDTIVGKPLRTPKDVVQEPSHPTGNREKLLTPYSALTAPDVTPGITQPIDRSKVPGQISVTNEFSAKDVEGAPPPVQAASLGGKDQAVNVMDVLLGRDRSAVPQDKEKEKFDQAGALATAEAVAASTLASMNASPLMESAASALAQGNGMPEHKDSDAKAVSAAFRKFNS